MEWFGFAFGHLGISGIIGRTEGNSLTMHHMVTIFIR